MSLRKKIIDSLKKRYDADIAQAESTVSIYLDNPVGIGEHPQHLEEIDKLLQKSVDAKEKKDMLINYE